MGHYVGFGHSHLACITWAFEELVLLEPGRSLYSSVNFLLPPYFPEVVTGDGIAVLNEAWVTAMRRELLDPGVIVFLCVSGSEWWRWSLTPGPLPFDFIDPVADDGLAPICQLVPYDLFMHQARSAFQSIRFVADVVRRYTSSPLLQFAPAPPARDVATILACDTERRHFVGEHGVSPARFRLKVWRACARAMAEICAELEVGFLMPPPRSLDEDGFLRPHLIGDAIHGNTAFGRLQIEQLCAHETRRNGAA